MAVRALCILCAIAFITGNSFADAACTGVLGETGHNCTPGNYWNSDAGTCKPCSPGRYCEGDGLAKCCHENFPNSTEGTSSYGDCYKPCSNDSDDTYSIQNCGLTEQMYEYTNSYDLNYYVNCAEDGVLNTWTDSNQYHMEKAHGFRCFLNERPCNKFDISWTDNPDNVTLDSVTVSGTAHWDIDSNSTYDTSECSSIAIFKDNRQPIKCKLKRPCPVFSYSLASATEPIQFNNKATGNQIYYYCMECINSGHYPTDYKPTGQQLHLPNCNNPDGGHTACSCNQISIGYYGTCNWTSSQPLNTCSPTPCPPGKTTDSPETTTINGCHYGANTQICDNGGCKSLGSFGNINDWVQLY